MEFSPDEVPAGFTKTASAPPINAMHAFAIPEARADCGISANRPEIPIFDSSDEVAANDIDARIIKTVINISFFIFAPLISSLQRFFYNLM
jgi:hypothetical protein